MAALYELTGQWKALLDMMEDPDIDQQAVMDTLEGLDYEIEEKADSYAKIIRTLEGEAEAFKTEMDRMAAKKKNIENNIDRMKRSLENCMVATNKRKFKTELFSFNIQKNAPSLDILDEKLVPREFYVQKEPELSRKAALQYIKDNGPQEWGTTRQTESLRIR
ncbi:MAG: siphovirus Gp157 family protein [Lachnospiraceae bacterium]|nr:siphovirus Gp157 family protein [Lachnospiraceae bacterium]